MCALVWGPLRCYVPWYGTLHAWYGTGTTHLCALMWTQDQACSLLLTSSDTALKAYFHHAFLSSLRGLPGLYFQNCLFRLYHSYVSMVSRALLNCITREQHGHFSHAHLPHPLRSTLCHTSLRSTLCHTP